MLRFSFFLYFIKKKEKPFQLIEGVKLNLNNSYNNNKNNNNSNLQEEKWIEEDEEFGVKVEFQG